MKRNGFSLSLDVMALAVESTLRPARASSWQIFLTSAKGIEPCLEGVTATVLWAGSGSMVSALSLFLHQPHLNFLPVILDHKEHFVWLQTARARSKNSGSFIPNAAPGPCRRFPHLLNIELVIILHLDHAQFPRLTRR